MKKELTTTSLNYAQAEKETKMKTRRFFFAQLIGVESVVAQCNRDFSDDGSVPQMGPVVVAPATGTN